MRVLVVVEGGIADAVRQILEREGHLVALANSGHRAVAAAEKLAFDAVVINTGPALDGFTVARLLRAAGVRTPILLLIARDAVRDVRRVIEAGADDFLIKPFSHSELAARLGALFGRTTARQSSRLQAEDLVLDAATREVWRAGLGIDLTPKEFQLLEILLRNSGRVVRRQELIEALWADNTPVESNKLDAFIRLLRRKIDRGRSTKLIRTVRGVGYRLSTE